MYSLPPMIAGQVIQTSVGARSRLDPPGDSHGSPTPLQSVEDRGAKLLATSSKLLVTSSMLATSLFLLALARPGTSLHSRAFTQLLDKETAILQRFILSPLNPLQVLPYGTALKSRITIPQYSPGPLVQRQHKTEVPCQQFQALKTRPDFLLHTNTDNNCTAQAGPFLHDKSTKPLPAPPTCCNLQTPHPSHHHNPTYRLPFLNPQAPGIHSHQSQRLLRLPREEQGEGRDTGQGGGVAAAFLLARGKEEQTQGF